MSVIPAMAVDGAVPLEPQYTLIRAADATPLTDAHWRAGVEVIPYPGPPAGGQGDFCDVDEVDYDDLPGVSAHLPFVVYGAVTCSTRSFNGAELRDRIRQSFAALVHQQVEDQFWNGSINSSTPHLTMTGANDLGSKGVVEGMGLIDQAAALLGGGAIIHMSPRLATAVAAKNLLRQDGRNLRTVAENTLVLPAGGYDGAAPSGLTANSGTKEYAIVTDQPHVVRGDLMVFPEDGNPSAGIVWRSNDAVALVQQEFITLFDPDKVSAVQIDRAT